MTPVVVVDSLETRGDKAEFGVEVEVAGLGPSDGFTSYRAFVGDPPRTRWGDYEAAVTDGTSIWIASEYIAQTCACAQYHPAPSLANVGSCDATLTSLGNWGTRVEKLALSPLGNPAARRTTGRLPMCLQHG